VALMLAEERFEALAGSVEQRTKADL